jgi:hypothetical protein
MSEADKVQYQAASHLLGTSLDPEIQQTALQRMERSSGSTPEGQNGRDDAYKRLKQSGIQRGSDQHFKLAEMGQKRFRTTLRGFFGLKIWPKSVQNDHSGLFGP